ncbi:polyprenyl synthetase family protein [Sporolactobacillus vineae]|uniref:polyprenyl synthetase family protein n=1 Tax=Sporolactobacillus vineae TaxID=444463 RepID=UPI00028A3408|nr:polyprenyl synthetase family protein [Sporolactobacillus vineae]
MRVHPMWDAYPELKEDLIRVLQVIESHIRIHDQAIEQRIRKYINTSGKMLRPAYTILCSEIGPEPDKERAIAAAAAVQCLHMATLIHDDVIDQSDTRHGQKTFNAEYGNKVAIYAGDYLFSLTFSILGPYASESSVPRLSFKQIEADKILAGELEQLHAQYRTPASVKHYLSQISGKTAQLFAISCYAGAGVGKSSQSDASHAWNMGHDIGMAFQIIDDILDYQGTQNVLGKPVMNDFRSGIYTLPVRIAMMAEPEFFRPLLDKKGNLTENDLTAVQEAIARNHGIEKAMDLARKYTRKALKEMDALPSGGYKKVLNRLSRSLLERKM